MMSSQVTVLLPSWLLGGVSTTEAVHAWLVSAGDAGKWVAMIALEHVLILIKVL
jgi:hypothetical protein